MVMAASPVFTESYRKGMDAATMAVKEPLHSARRAPGNPGILQRLNGLLWRTLREPIKLSRPRTLHLFF